MSLGRFVLGRIGSVGKPVEIDRDALVAKPIEAPQELIPVIVLTDVKSQ